MKDTKDDPRTISEDEARQMIRAAARCAAATISTAHEGSRQLARGGPTHEMKYVLTDDGFVITFERDGYRCQLTANLSDAAINACHTTEFDALFVMRWDAVGPDSPGLAEASLIAGMAKARKNILRAAMMMLDEARERAHEAGR